MDLAVASMCHVYHTPFTVLLVFLVGVSGAVVWSFGPSLLLLLREGERRNDPLALYLSACALQFGISGFLLLSFFSETLASIMVPVGVLLGFVTLLAASWQKVMDQPMPRCKRTPPRMQCWIIDACVAMLFYGLATSVAMVGFEALGSNIGLRRFVFHTFYADYLESLPQLQASRFLSIVMISLFCVVGIGLLVALDVFRRQPKPLGSFRRGSTLALILTYFTMTAAIGGLAAWVVWRIALPKTNTNVGVAKQDGARDLEVGGMGAK